MYQVRTDGFYFWIVLVQQNLADETIETSSGLGLWVTPGEAQDAADRLNKVAK